MNVVCDQMNAHLSLLITYIVLHWIAEQLLLKIFFDWKLCLDCDEMNEFCDQMNAHFSFLITFPKSHCIAEQPLLKNFFD